MKIITKTSDGTQRVGELLAAYAFPGAVIVLEGQLGAGKTTFTKGIARGLGIEKTIKSPTYTLIREYDDQDIPLYHMDMYRLEDTGVGDLGLEEYLYGQGVSVVEWARFIAEEMPTEYMEITIHQLEKEPSQRMIRFRVIGQKYEQWLQLLLEELAERQGIETSFEVCDER